MMHGACEPSRRNPLRLTDGAGLPFRIVTKLWSDVGAVQFNAHP
jgi:hypothetical protein